VRRNHPKEHRPWGRTTQQKIRSRNGVQEVIDAGRREKRAKRILTIVETKRQTNAEITNLKANIALNIKIKIKVKELDDTENIRKSSIQDDDGIVKRENKGVTIGQKNRGGEIENGERESS
jgi:hypothetical protein